MDDWIYLKVLSMKGVMRFKNNGTFSPHYIWPYRIMKRVGILAYELELPPKLVTLHPIYFDVEELVGRPFIGYLY